MILGAQDTCAETVQDGMTYLKSRTRQVTSAAAGRRLLMPAMLLISCVTLPAFGSDDWVMGFHDGRHTGQTSEVVTPPMGLAWTWKDTYPYDNGNGGQFAPQPAFWLPVYYRGKLCFQGGLNANRVFCLNPATGAVVWEADNPGYSASAPYL